MPLFKGTVPQDSWADIKSVGSKGLEHALSLLATSSWGDPRIEEGLSTTTAKVEGSKMVALKAELEIPYPIQSCIACLYGNIDVDENSPPEARERYPFRKAHWPSKEDEAHSQKIHDYIDPKKYDSVEGGEPKYDLTALVHYVVASPSSIVSPREFITVRVCRELEKVEGKRRLCIANTSWQPANLAEIIPEATKAEKWVRAIVHAQLIVFEETAPGSGKTKATFMVHTDPCGSVPAMIANKVIIHQASTLTNIKTTLEKLLK